MKRKICFMMIVLLTGLVLGSAVLAGPRTGSGPIGRKIVVFDKKTFANEPVRDAVLGRAGIHGKIKDLPLVNGVVVIMPSKAAERALRKEAGIARIDDDVRVEALAQTLPWGVDRIDAEKAWSTTTGDPVKVAIIDTGIASSHPDLSANLKGGVSTVGYTSKYNDDNGHGTHVAGTVAALNNTTGVVGVGPKIDLYAVKVLDRFGSGYLSDVIEGLDWAVGNGMKVVNMSLGTSSYNKSLEDAVKRVNAAGIVQVAAAGNSGSADNTVNYPAKFAQVIAVGATDSSTSNNIAYWSSRGPEVDLAAPGVNIYSTWPSRSYKTLSGTSMASPHVAGTAALVLTRPVGAYDLDADSVWDPIEVQNKLEFTATDLGAAGKDNLYGSGLVNAERAVQ